MLYAYQFIIASQHQICIWIKIIHHEFFSRACWRFRRFSCSNFEYLLLTNTYRIYIWWHINLWCCFCRTRRLVLWINIEFVDSIRYTKYTQKIYAHRVARFLGKPVCVCAHISVICTYIYLYIRICDVYEYRLRQRWHTRPTRDETQPRVVDSNHDLSQI